MFKSSRPFQDDIMLAKAPSLLAWITPRTLKISQSKDGLRKCTVVHQECSVPSRSMSSLDFLSILKTGVRLWWLITLVTSYLGLGAAQIVVRCVLHTPVLLKLAAT